ncbi:glycerol-3-phosphate dehydrogenase/oxidase [Aliifodinibius sp. 1BSP15-2V2]|uniref:Glycerol-3-phosphate dehydrogenase/oxidase n=1 Tax=Fodinibius salsisoli TaxID=2820877 RepID=A0ABT3PNE4_9BACT|nr:glycerol-3-phosphate dehydrogenase/oxidase [Fodinibius salsisoli]MCW9707019.1 glycerol-3-phosphate dehydrogenase/oxidase [Fodinibius salsisoli]
MTLDRDELITQLQDDPVIWDFIIIGGGATGLGTAVEAASRGYRTLLLEQHDFAKGTSSRSTKLVHGGVRYLRQGNVSLVLEALRERGLLRQNAPHLVKNQSFIVPNYDWWEGPFYGIGLKIYDKLAGDLGLGPSENLSKEETLAKIPTLEPDDLNGGVIYHDAQFDDSRLAINLLQTLFDHDGIGINYMEVTDLLKANGLISGVKAEDREGNHTFELQARAVINATGIFTDSIRKMDDPDNRELIRPSQGVHIVLDESFQPGESAIMVPKTDDGRVLFAVPWHDRIIVGTTDTPIEAPSLEPRAKEEEVEFLLTHAARYLTKDPEPEDVLSVFAGIRPLVANKNSKDTSSISRDHSLIIDPSGLVTIAGGKWTTYRKMAEDTIDEATMVAGLDERESITDNLRLHGWLKNSDAADPFELYGSDALALKKIASEQADGNPQLHPNLPYTPAEVIWAARSEMARTVEDVLARRTRALLLDARASIEIAEPVAKLMARELNYDHQWVTNQVETYTELAKGYFLSP